MDEAIVVFSRKGLFKKRIAARDIRSREHARKLWPLVSETKYFVTWVRPIFSNGELQRRSHFRLLPREVLFDPRELLEGIMHLT
jgi:hypothetical protein